MCIVSNREPSETDFPEYYGFIELWFSEFFNPRCKNSAGPEHRENPQHHIDGAYTYRRIQYQLLSIWVNPLGSVCSYYFCWWWWHNLFHSLKHNEIFQQHEYVTHTIPLCHAKYIVYCISQGPAKWYFVIRADHGCVYIAPFYLKFCALSLPL